MKVPGFRGIVSYVMEDSLARAAEAGKQGLPRA